MLKQLLAATTVGCVLLAAGCSDDDKDNDKEKQAVTANQEAIKANHANIAFEVYSDSLTTAENLQTAVNAFLADPTEPNLEAARTKYKDMRPAYQQSEIMRWDETITLGKNLDQDGGLTSVDDWEGQVNAWPLDETKIEEIINGTDNIDAALLISQNGVGGEANVTTGVHAIEFMLWDQDADAKGPGQRAANEFASNSTCLANNSSIECRRSAYLKAAMDLLVDDITAMKAEWSPEAQVTQGTLAYNFLTSNEAIDYMAQAFASMAVGELGGARLSAGLWRPAETQPNNTLKVGDYEEEHDCFSDLSHVALYHNFIGLKNLFNGIYTSPVNDRQVGNGNGLGSIIKAVDQGLYNKISSIISNTEADIKTMFDAGENGSKSFDQIIADSEAYYTDTTGTVVKSAELIAVEKAIAELAKAENEITNFVEAYGLSAFDADGIGETD